ncbi:hypothetical protein JOD03_002739 [Chryseomicrobium aureum]|nr:hypothetical protein [Chryseomicrobium aureum]
MEDGKRPTVSNKKRKAGSDSLSIFEEQVAEVAIDQ